MSNKENQVKTEIVIYQSKTGSIELKADTHTETIWATQSQMAADFRASLKMS